MYMTVGGRILRAKWKNEKTILFLTISRIICSFARAKNVLDVSFFLFNENFRNVRKIQVAHL